MRFISNLENAQKWKQNEKKEGELDFTYADRYADFWNSLKIPFRGHCLFWGTTGSSVHVPDWFANNPTYQAMVKRTFDAASRYEGSITGWDIFNEILHDSDYFLNLFGQGV